MLRPSPRPAAHFVGRTDEVEEVIGRLVSDSPYSILLYGSGGIGKTGSCGFRLSSACRRLILMCMRSGQPLRSRCSTTSGSQITLARASASSRARRRPRSTRSGRPSPRASPSSLPRARPLERPSSPPSAPLPSGSFRGFLDLDNFEATRTEEPEGAAEAFLAELTDGTRLSLLVTFQGNVAWADMEWSHKKRIERKTLEDAVSLYGRTHEKEDTKGREIGRAHV